MIGSVPTNWRCTWIAYMDMEGDGFLCRRWHRVERGRECLARR